MQFEIRTCCHSYSLLPVLASIADNHISFSEVLFKLPTDNGTEWTNALLVKKSTHKTLFEEYLEECGIKYHRIQVAPPKTQWQGRTST